MKVAVIYYSLEGNTKYVAQKIAKVLNADLLGLLPVKKYPTGKVSKFLWGGKSVAFKETPELEAYSFDYENYDLIVLGTPIWAGTFAPPFRTFLRDNKITKKNIAFFACSGGGTAEKCFEQFTKETTNCNVLSTLKLVDPTKNINTEDNNRIDEFCTKLKTDMERLEDFR